MIRAGRWFVAGAVFSIAALALTSGAGAGQEDQFTPEY